MSELAAPWWKRIFAAAAVPADAQSPATAERAPADRRAEPRWPAFAPALLEWIDTADEDQSLPVHVVERSDNGLAVRSPRRIERGWLVQVTLPPESAARAVVRNVRRDEDGWRLGLRLIRGERRRFERRPAHGPIRVAWQDGDGRRHERTATLRDVGEGGIRFALDAVLEPGWPVALSSAGARRFAVVVQRSADGPQAEYGVQFTGPTIVDASVDYAG